LINKLKMTTTEDLYQLYLQHRVISTDTRKITPGSIFFALKGEKFDANTFAKQALEAGAAFVVIDNNAYQVSGQCLLVDDVLITLQSLARYHRQQLNIPVIGLTGTNGKTTTKEIVAAVLSQQFTTHATQGNLNNHIGVPLTILAIKPGTQMAVIEMGANHQTEIAFLSGIAQPTHGLITNVGKAHLEGFGGVEGVKKGKGELYIYLKEHNGIAFINHNSNDLLEMAKQRGLSQVIYYGSDETDAICGHLIENDPYLTLDWQKPDGEQYRVQSQLTGAYNLDNILAAICIGNYFGLSAAQINAGVQNYCPTNNRSQITQTKTNTLICDYYNANPSSMSVAIENISNLKASNKVMILGDMFELGDDSNAEHAAIVAKAMAASVDHRIFIGPEFYKQSELINASFYRTADDAMAELKSKPLKNATVLIKGSRGMALERLVALF
jgi:UDP-N-acetylmuramoyl-tripeptide--D-alanyl-D-alanine ligase